MTERRVCGRWMFGAIVAAGLVLASSTLWATPTGLNNIPTADVVPLNTLEVQAYSTGAEGDDQENFVGVRFSFLDGLEVGIDDKIGPQPDPMGPVTFQGKYAIPLGENLPIIAGGVSNLSTDDERNGEAFPYVVATHDFGWLRGHLGVDAEEDNEGFFAGLDKTLDFADGPLMVRWDILQTNDMDDVLTSLGFIYTFPWSMAVEGWYTWTTVDEAEDTVTVRADFIIKF